MKMDKYVNLPQDPPDQGIKTSDGKIVTSQTEYTKCPIIYKIVQQSVEDKLPGTQTIILRGINKPKGKMLDITTSNVCSFSYQEYLKYDNNSKQRENLIIYDQQALKDINNNKLKVLLDKLDYIMNNQLQNKKFSKINFSAKNNIDYLSNLLIKIINYRKQLNKKQDEQRRNEQMRQQSQNGMRELPQPVIDDNSNKNLFIKEYQHLLNQQSIVIQKPINIKRQEIDLINLTQNAIDRTHNFDKQKRIIDSNTKILNSQISFNSQISDSSIFINQQLEDQQNNIIEHGQNTALQQSSQNDVRLSLVFDDPNKITSN